MLNSGIEAGIASVEVLEQDGLDPLIMLISDTEPDVQKNFIEAISLLLEDFQSRSAIRQVVYI